MQIAGHDIGVCSWSLRARDFARLAEAVNLLGLEHVQIGLGPLLAMDAKHREAEVASLKSSGLKLTAGTITFPGEDYSSIAIIKNTGGFVPEDQWPLRRKMLGEAGDLAAGLGITQISCHIGFIPPSSHPHYKKSVGRVSEGADLLATKNITLLTETGQETGPELLQFLNDVGMKNVKCNFDPANMLLYGNGDPIDALHILGRHIAHVHIKDAILSPKPGVTWGTEVPFGQGQVNPEELVVALHEIGYQGPLVIERESTAEIMSDIQEAIDVLKDAATAVA